MITGDAGPGDPPGLAGPRHGQRHRHRHAKGYAYLLAAASLACGGISAVLGIMAYRSRQPGNLRDWATLLALLSVGTLCLLSPLAGLDVKRRRKELPGAGLPVGLVLTAAMSGAVSVPPGFWRHPGCGRILRRGFIVKGGQVGFSPGSAVPKNPKWLPRLHDPGHLHLWRIGYALAACFALAVAGLAALWVVALVLLHHPALPHSHVISVHDTVGVAQLVFASVAGVGALVALVVAYRRQRVAEDSASHDRTRVLNELFTTIAAQLGDTQPAVRLAGVHAMAGLADDWKENRQTCIDVLCAYLRLPYDPDPGGDAAPPERAAYRANREVRHTIVRLICTHLRHNAAASREGRDFDFTRVVFDGGDFTGARFSGGIVRFDGATFASGLAPDPQPRRAGEALASKP